MKIRWIVLSALACATVAIVAQVSRPPDNAVNEQAPNLFAPPRPSPPPLPQAGPRVIPFAKGLNIAGRLDAQEESLVVVRTEARPFAAGPPDGMSLIEYLTRTTSAAAVVTVLGKEAVLSPDEDWAQSDVDVRVVRVLKSSTLSIHDGQRLTLPEEGGDVIIGSTTVRFRVSWATQMAVGRDYLVFLYAGRRGGIRKLHAGWTFELVDDKLRSLDSDEGLLIVRSSDADGGLKPASATEVIDEVTFAAGLSPLGRELRIQEGRQ